jgi:hypothetical protein
MMTAAAAGRSTEIQAWRHRDPRSRPISARLGQSKDPWRSFELPRAEHRDTAGGQMIRHQYLKWQIAKQQAKRDREIFDVGRVTRVVLVPGRCPTASCFHKVLAKGCGVP